MTWQEEQKEERYEGQRSNKRATLKSGDTAAQIA